MICVFLLFGQSHLIARALMVRKALFLLVNGFLREHLTQFFDSQDSHRIGHHKIKDRVSNLPQIQSGDIGMVVSNMKQWSDSSRVHFVCLFVSGGGVLLMACRYRSKTSRQFKCQLSAVSIFEVQEEGTTDFHNLHNTVTSFDSPGFYIRLSETRKR